MPIELGYPDRIAVRCLDGSHTYRELRLRAIKIARSLRDVVAVPSSERKFSRSKEWPVRTRVNGNAPCTSIQRIIG